MKNIADASRHVAALVLVLSAAATTRSGFAAGDAETPVTGTLAAAIAAVRPGSILTLEPRVYAEGHLQIGASGTPDAPIIVRGMAGSQLNGRITFGPGVAHWRLEGFGIDGESIKKDGQVDAVRIGPGAHSITIQRMTLRNGPMYGVRVEDGAHDVAITDSTIAGFWNEGTDAHGIGVQAASAITITGNTLSGNSGDGVQLHTNDTLSSTRVASSVVIAGNTIFGNRENAIDIKSAHGVAIVGNVLHTHLNTKGEGIAIQIQYGARDIDIRSNVITNNLMGIELTRGKKDGADYPRAPSNVRIIGNLIRDSIFDPTFSNAGNGTGIVLRGGTNVIVANNTVYNAQNAGMYMGVNSAGELTQGLFTRNNVLGGARNDLNYNADFDKQGGPVFAHNHYVGGRVRDKALAQWAGSSTPLRDAAASSGDPKLDANGLPIAGSPLIDSGVDLGLSLPHSGAAPDRGWSEFAAGGAQVPTPSPTDTPAPPATRDPTLTRTLFLPMTRRR
jgi:hypothetical protein